MTLLWWISCEFTVSNILENTKIEPICFVNLFLETKRFFVRIIYWISIDSFLAFFTEARSLISWMLSRDPDARPTLEQVRRHPWINKRHWGACPGLPWAGHVQQVQGGTCKTRNNPTVFQASREVNIRTVCQRFPSAGHVQQVQPKGTCRGTIQLGPKRFPSAGHVQQVQKAPVNPIQVGSTSPGEITSAPFASGFHWPSTCCYREAPPEGHHILFKQWSVPFWR